MTDETPTPNDSPAPDESAGPYERAALEQQSTAPAGPIVSGGAMEVLPGDSAAAYPLADEKSGRRTLPVALSAVAVVLVLVAAGVIVGPRLLKAKSAGPAQYVPASAWVYAEINLGPSGSQEKDAVAFEQKFAAAPHVTAGESLKDAMLAAAFQNDPTVKYDTDIKPWLGDHAAVGVYPGSNGAKEPVSVAILQSRDDAKARAFLAKQAAASPADSGYVVRNGYVILGQDQATVNAALSAAQSASLAKSSVYKKDIAALDSNRIGTAWIDGAGALTALKKANPEVSKVLSAEQMFGFAPKTTGRFVVSLKIASNNAEIRMKEVGGTKPAVTALKTDAKTLLGELPVSTDAGVAIAGSANSSTALTQLEKSPTYPLIKSEFDAIGAKLGIKFPGDVVNLLGTGFALGGQRDTTGVPVLATLRTLPANIDQAMATANKLTPLAGQVAGPINVSRDGKEVVVTNDARFPGPLANNASFKAAMADMPDHLSLAAYLNPAHLADPADVVPASTTDPSAGPIIWFKHITGVGFGAGVDGDTTTFVVRLIAN